MFSKEIVGEAVLPALMGSTRFRYSCVWVVADVKYRHTSSYCASLYCGLQILSFLQIEGLCGNPASNKSVSTIFPTAFAHFASLCHILVILTISQTFHQQTDYNLLKAQMIAFLAIKYFFKLLIFKIYLFIYLFISG